jgi:IclR family KDG regulon transcriptional repressor
VREHVEILGGTVGDLPQSTDGNQRYAGALAKITKILAALERDTWLGASELAAALDVDRSTAYRLAQALTRLDWLRQDPETKRYRLGLRLWELGARAVSDLDVRALALPHMRDVVSATGESCDLAILDGGTIIYIEKVDGTHEVRAYTHIGQRQPAHAVAMGKVLMAYLSPDERLRRLPQPLTRFTTKTVSTLAEFDRECDDVLRDGYALNLGEYNAEAGGIAAPVIDRYGLCTVAVGINVPTARLTAAYISTLARTITRCAERISAEFGSPTEVPSHEAAP